MKAFGNIKKPQQQQYNFGKSTFANTPESVLKSKNLWTIEQAFKILECQYKEIRQRRFQSFQLNNIQNLDQLYAQIVQHWCQQLIKEGLFKGYVYQEAKELQCPQGQINIQDTLRLQTMLRGHVICSYDELSEDVYINRVLKTIMEYIITFKEVDNQIKRDITKVLLKIGNIKQCDIHRIKWGQIRYENNTYRYKNLIDFCKWIYTERKYEDKQGKLDSSVRVYLLFKRCIFNIINMQFGEKDAVESYRTQYILKNEPIFERYFFKEQPAAVVQIKGLQLLFMVRLQNKEFYANDFNIDNKKMEEVFNCQRMYEDDRKQAQVGVMIQINLQHGEYNVEPMNTQLLDHRVIGSIQVDLWDKWDFVLARLKNPYDYFIQRKKDKDSR